ncbi:odorant receptor 13a-like [Bombyx mandarina]|uniref:Odorant receptor n=1 Tax=Bombyx mandarina TaxID=7092 RepID=A0A6J2J9E4_BOMMA|nr:odorant receptor 13a-like [Bombyx mandarina]
MGLLTRAWKKLSDTDALRLSSGYYETAFYEPVYRVAYLVGLSSLDRSVSYLVYSAVVKMMIGMFIGGELWFVCTESLSLDEIASSINVIVIQMTMMLKLKNLVEHKDIYRRLATSMESPYFDIRTEKRRQIFEHWVKTHERTLKFLLFLGNGSLAAWYIHPLIDEFEYNLMVGLRLPFSFDTPLRYLCTYVIVLIAFNYTAHYVMVTDLIMQSYLIPLICQYAVLADCFENILIDCSNDYGDHDMEMHERSSDPAFIRIYMKRLSNLVEQHSFLLDRSMELRAILSRPMLGQLASSGLLICFVGYQATTSISVNIVKCLMSLFYLGYNMFTLFVVCRWCEEITNKSLNIGNAVYCSGWESGMTVVPTVRSTILLVILRANKPIVFTAGGMYNLSLTSYTSLVKGSYSALTFLLRIQHE